MGAICRGGGSSSFGLQRDFDFAVNPPQLWRLIGLDREHDRSAMGL